MTDSDNVVMIRKSEFLGGLFRCDATRGPRTQTMASSKEEKYDIGDIKDNLPVILDSIQSSASFIAGYYNPSAAVPGLCIPSVGNIRVPISPEDAKAIIRSCHPSPDGKGSWELDPSQFALQNPQWEAEVGQFVNKAVAGLGIIANPADVKAELYKLLIYEEGAFSRPHQDSENANGMLGTLAVYLPSKHEGGNVIASHRDARTQFKTAPTSEFGLPGLRGMRMSFMR
ncbi:hypothetical protein BO78DRAFT_448688 [Aspergillus sclerotiicarbonarius CBS 121057]|uniref:Prolyl 4-hydroxylase alpha subunit Fe(2+) 2OG dioxygenase domain-containing protein n=1 Tax=Aspergillus sclerotiicarbonarius (strain CBS 121057 / IBT 28362) TaxID=1448318 RepID=A0A319EU33_ASPSB|nr:hypothetical protein BO78DRAFT_448688 [Aspergillus sclerotiicarbonarius CBS 121057]